MKKVITILLFLLLASLLIAACGGGGDKPAPAQQPETSKAEAQPAVAAGDAANGEKLFNTTCIACHGQGGVGVQGLGKDMTTSEFLLSVSDAELIAFIKQGRDPSDPLNTTGVAMPSKGGNPALTDENLADIVAYVRTLHK